MRLDTLTNRDRDVQTWTNTATTRRGARAPRPPTPPRVSLRMVGSLCPDCPSSSVLTGNHKHQRRHIHGDGCIATACTTALSITISRHALPSPSTVGRVPVGWRPRVRACVGEGWGRRTMPPTHPAIRGSPPCPNCRSSATLPPCPTPRPAIATTSPRRGSCAGGRRRRKRASGRHCATVAAMARRFAASTPSAPSSPISAARTGCSSSRSMGRSTPRNARRTPTGRRGCARPAIGCCASRTRRCWIACRRCCARFTRPRWSNRSCPRRSAVGPAGEGQYRDRGQRPAGLSGR